MAQQNCSVCSRFYLLALSLVFCFAVTAPAADRQELVFKVQELKLAGSVDGLYPLALTSADFDEDGIPDLISAYAGSEGGILILHRGNVNSIYPNRPEAMERKAKGTLTDSPFFSPAQIFDLPEPPDFIGAGDFDADGHTDLVSAAHYGRMLYFSSGNGQGDLAPARSIEVAGPITTLAVGEINRRDGLNDIFVGVIGADGPQALVIEGPNGALRHQPEGFPLHAPATAFALGQLDDSYEIDLAVAAGRQSPIIGVEGVSMAILPMRLNIDGSQDLVLLSEGSLTPKVALTMPQAIFTVNSTADDNDGDCNGPSGDCTLREAILAANNTVGADSIQFNIGAGTPTINVGAATNLDLPTITETVTINGNTGGATRVELNGTSVTMASNATFGIGGLNLNATGCVVRNLVINRFHFSGVGDGIDVRMGSNLIEGNFIGTDVTGTMDLGNSDVGVQILGASNNTIGGTSASARNLISGNDGNGISISGTFGTGNTVQGNFIGTDGTGMADLGNAIDGVAISLSTNNVIGGTVPAARNLISGNQDDGVDIDGSATSGNLVQGNYIGTDVTGIVDLGNSFNGVEIDDASNNTVGGPTAAAGNIIMGNNGIGVRVDDFAAPATSNRIQSNSIFSNSDLGIDLNDDGVTANDNDDPDNGPNNLQNYPVLTSVNISGIQTTIGGNLNSTPNSQFTIQFFSNSPCDSSGRGEGKTFLGSTQVTTDNNGDVSFSVMFPVDLSGQSVTTTATDTNGNTSEFSACLTEVLPCIYEDLFDDGVLDWIVVKPNVTESGGFLVLTPAGRKAAATSPAAFAGCSTCTFTAEISLDGGFGQKAWMLTHRIDKKNQIEILFKEASDKIIVKQKSGGATLVKAKANFTILPNTIYRVALTYDGTNVTLKIDGATVLSFPAVGVVPAGIFGFQDKNGTLSVNRVCVN